MDLSGVLADANFVTSGVFGCDFLEPGTVDAGQAAQVTLCGLYDLGEEEVRRELAVEHRAGVDFHCLPFIQLKK